MYHNKNSFLPISAVVLLGLLLLGLFPRMVMALDYDDAADGDWSASATWGVASGYPGTGSDTALIDDTRTIKLDVDVTLDSFTVKNNKQQSVYADSPHSITTDNFLSQSSGNFAIDTGASLDIRGTGLFQTRGGEVNGTINVLNGAVLTYTINHAQDGSGLIHIQSGGKIDMQSNTYFSQYGAATAMSVDNDGLFELNNPGTFYNQALSVTGDGQWRVNSGGIAFKNSGQTILLNPNTATFTGSAGTVSFLDVANATHTLGSFDMGGTSNVNFGADDDATFQINGSSTFQDLTLSGDNAVDFAPATGGAQTHTVNGALNLADGTLAASAAGGAILNVQDFTRTGSGNAIISAGVTLNILDTGSWIGNQAIENEGAINLQEGATFLHIGREFTGNGSLNIATNAVFTLDGSSNATRIIEPDIVNNGTLKSVNGNLRNMKGAVSGTGTFLSESGTLDVHNATVDGWSGSGTFASQATWHAKDAGVIKLTGSDNSIDTIGGTATVILENGGKLSQLNDSARDSLGVDGVLQVRGTSNLLFNSGQGINLTGVLGGDGTISGNVISTGGTIRPGNSPGTLTINGDLSLDDASLLDFELGGAMSDLLVVTGEVSLDGVLNVTDLDGFQAGTYNLIQYGALTDNDLELGMMPSGGFSYSLLTGGGFVQLQVTSGGIPEPASGALLGVGLLLVLGGGQRRRRKQR